MFRIWLLLLAACSSPHWSVQKSDVTHPLLSVWASAHGAVHYVGGNSFFPATALWYKASGPGAALQPLDVSGHASLWWVFGLAEDDVFAVGESGTILHYDGTSVTAESSGLTDIPLFGIWGTAPDQMWAVGGQPDGAGVILQRAAVNGGYAWHDVTPAGQHYAFLKVWGAAANDIYVCGRNYTMLHYDGSAFSPTFPTQLGLDLRTVYGSSAKRVYAVGGRGVGLAIMYDGTAWKTIDDPIITDLSTLAGVSVNAGGDVVFVGDNGGIVRGHAGKYTNDSDAISPRRDLHSATFAGSDIVAVGGEYQFKSETATGVIEHYGP